MPSNQREDVREVEKNAREKRVIKAKEELDSLRKIFFEFGSSLKDRNNKKISLIYQFVEFFDRNIDLIGTEISNIFLHWNKFLRYSILANTLLNKNILSKIIKFMVLHKHHSNKESIGFLKELLLFTEYFTYPPINDLLSAATGFMIRVKCYCLRCCDDIIRIITPFVQLIYRLDKYFIFDDWVQQQFLLHLTEFLIINFLILSKNNLDKENGYIRLLYFTFNKKNINVILSDSKLLKNVLYVMTFYFFNNFYLISRMVIESYKKECVLNILELFETIISLSDTPKYSNIYADCERIFKSLAELFHEEFILFQGHSLENEMFMNINSVELTLLSKNVVQIDLKYICFLLIYYLDSYKPAKNKTLIYWVFRFKFLYFLINKIDEEVYLNNWTKISMILNPNIISFYFADVVPIHNCSQYSYMAYSLMLAAFFYSKFAKIPEFINSKFVDEAVDWVEKIIDHSIDLTNETNLLASYLIFSTQVMAINESKTNVDFNVDINIEKYCCFQIEKVSTIPLDQEKLKRILPSAFKHLSYLWMMLCCRDMPVSYFEEVKKLKDHAIYQKKDTNSVLEALFNLFKHLDKRSKVF